jgi:protein gp37
MGSKTSIEWTRGEDGSPGATWTPIRARNKATGKIGWHCEHDSHGCKFCYSEAMNKRLGTGLPFKPGHRKDIEIFLDENLLLAPLRWKRPRMIFVCSMTDLFAGFVPDEWIDRVFAIMALCPQHTFQVLTKRSKRMREYFEGNADQTRRSLVNNTCFGLSRWLGARFTDEQCHIRRWPLPNVWLGVSAEDQARADERIPDLLDTPAAVRFVSAEPLLDSIDFKSCWLHRKTLCGGRPSSQDGTPIDCPCADERLDWIIAGAESGRGARASQEKWFRAIKDQCVASGTAFFLKQYAINGRKIHTPELDGRTWTEFPR